MTHKVRVLLVGGPMYDPLYDAIPAFERASGLTVEIVDRLAHPELNAYVRHVFEHGEPDIDLLSTHTKYAPSQAQWLTPLDSLIDAETIADLLPRPLELAKVDDVLLQVPRNLDVRLLHYRKDLIAQPPSTWTGLAEVAAAVTSHPTNGHEPLYGFLYPGRDSGLFGTFYELLIGDGGRLFDDDLRPAFDSRAGVWAAGFPTSSTSAVA